MRKVKLQKVEIPPIGMHLLVNVKLNNTLAKFVVDSGASRSVVDREFLEQIVPKLEIEDVAALSAGVGASNLQSSVASIAKFRIGRRFLVEDYQIALMDLTHVKNSYAELGADLIYGVLGSDVLENLNAVIDYRKLELRFYEK